MWSSHERVYKSHGTFFFEMMKKSQLNATAAGFQWTKHKHKRVFEINQVSSTLKALVILSVLCLLANKESTVFLSLTLVHKKLSTGERL